MVCVFFLKRNPKNFQMSEKGRIFYGYGLLRLPILNQILSVSDSNESIFKIVSQAVNPAKTEKKDVHRSVDK